MQRFGDPKVNLHPDTIDNFTMGTVFVEELIRKFNEALNENPGEHFTPRGPPRRGVPIRRYAFPDIALDGSDRAPLIARGLAECSARGRANSDDCFPLS